MSHLWQRWFFARGSPPTIGTAVLLQTRPWLVVAEKEKDLFVFSHSTFGREKSYMAREQTFQKSYFFFRFRTNIFADNLQTDHFYLWHKFQNHHFPLCWCKTVAGTEGNSIHCLFSRWVAMNKMVVTVTSFWLRFRCSFRWYLSLFLSMEALRATNTDWLLELSQPIRLWLRGLPCGAKWMVQSEKAMKTESETGVIRDTRFV